MGYLAPRFINLSGAEALPRCRVLAALPPVRSRDGAAGKEVVRYRYLLLSSYIVLAIAIYGFTYPQVLHGQLLAGLGILVVLSFVAAPFWLGWALGDWSRRRSPVTLVFLVLAVCFLGVVIVVVTDIWPQLMSI